MLPTVAVNCCRATLLDFGARDLILIASSSLRSRLLVCVSQPSPFTLELVCLCKRSSTSAPPTFSIVQAERWPSRRRRQGRAHRPRRVQHSVHARAESRRRKALLFLLPKVCLRGHFEGREWSADRSSCCWWSPFSLSCSRRHFRYCNSFCLLSGNHSELRTNYIRRFHSLKTKATTTQRSSTNWYISFEKMKFIYTCFCRFTSYKEQTMEKIRQS